MKVFMGMFTIWCEPCQKAPTPKELARADKRIIYLGDIRDKKGELLHDAFIFTLRPLEALTIKDTEAKASHAVLDFERHDLDYWKTFVTEIYPKHKHEEYIGTVCIDTCDDGRVFHDVYETELGSNIFYQKGKNGEHIPIVDEDGAYIQLTRGLLSYPDRYHWRISTTKKEGTCKRKMDYAFLWGVSGYNKWVRIPSDRKARHNFAKDVDSIDDWEVRNGMKELSAEIQKRFASSYSTRGFLNACN
jgi:hypothetical protein